MLTKDISKTVKNALINAIKKRFNNEYIKYIVLNSNNENTTFQLYSIKNDKLGQITIYHNSTQEFIDCVEYSKKG